MTEPIAVVVLTRDGLALAQRLQTALGNAETHGLARRVSETDVSFQSVSEHLSSLYRAGRSIVAICAIGIVVRALAPLLADKAREPPVVALSTDGRSIVPLLGGHRGANGLARRLAGVLDGHAAITTASDADGCALDDPPVGWTVANPTATKEVAAAVLAGEPVRLVAEAGDTEWIRGAGDQSALGGPSIRTTDRNVSPSEGELLLHPPTLAVGIGCERGAPTEEIIELVDQSLAASGLTRASVACVASIDLKTDEPAIHAAASALGAPARFFDAASLEAQRPRLANPSNAVFAEVGCHGVAEGAALAAAGPAGVLHTPKQKTARGTCAIARRVGGIDASRVGRPAGRLTLVGLGPGAAEYRLPLATTALRQATDIVGYGGYVDQLEPIDANIDVHRFVLGEEELRCRHALHLAHSGRSVALVCSGDPGIYAMAALVFQLLEQEPLRILIDVVPGVSALQIAAARMGAPLGHDFCAVSLSDLLTPWPEIERRLDAAGRGDFVVALYNPASRQRQSHLVRAREVLLQHRAPDTPVLIGRQLAREGEQVACVRLGDLDVARVDMLSLVIIGNSTTRSFDSGVRRWLYTPRGYASKARSAA